jgi:hypothetical protein
MKELEQLGTKLDPSLGRRLRVYAAINGRKVQDVVSAALDRYLPPLTDLVSAGSGEPIKAAAYAAIEQPEPANDPAR